MEEKYLITNLFNQIFAKGRNYNSVKGNKSGGSDNSRLSEVRVH